VTLLLREFCATSKGSSHPANGAKLRAFALQTPNERIAPRGALRSARRGWEALYERRSQDGERREKGSSGFSKDGKIVSGSEPRYDVRARQGSVRE